MEKYIPKPRQLRMIFNRKKNSDFKLQALIGVFEIFHENTFWRIWYFWIGSLLLDKLQKILLKEQEKQHHSKLQHNTLTKYERKERLHSVTCWQPSGGLSPPVNDHLTGNKTVFLCNYRWVDSGALSWDLFQDRNYIWSHHKLLCYAHLWQSYAFSDDINDEKKTGHPV